MTITRHVTPYNMLATLPHLLVLLVVHGLIGKLIVLDPLLKVCHGLLGVSALVVRATQLHLLRGGRGKSRSEKKLEEGGHNFSRGAKIKPLGGSTNEEARYM